MVYEYSPAGDDFYLREGSAEDPRSMEDCYQGDKAGSFANHTRTGITGTDGTGVAVDYALRPADYIVLGGASQDLWLLIENWTDMTSATIRIIGTDRDGNAQTEDINITGNGTYYATKWFKTVTQTQVTAFSGTGSFDCKLEQGQYGAISRIGSKTYVVHSNFWVWHYSPYTAALALVDVAVTFKKEFRRYYTACYVRLGELQNGRGINGSKVIVEGSQPFVYGKMYIYGSICNFAPSDTRNEVIDSIMLTTQRQYTVDDVYKRDTIYGGFRTRGGMTSDKTEDVIIHGGGGIFYGAHNDRVWNITCVNTSYDIYNYYNATTYYRDCGWSKNKIHSNSDGIIYDEYTLNLKITDKNGTGVPALSVKAYKNGDYTGLEPNDGADPILDTSTDGNGKIPEQGLVQWEWDNGQIADYNPFLWVLEHPNYPTKKFIMTMPRRKLEDGDWIYAYAEEETGTHEQILSAISKHDKKLTGLVA